MPVPSQGLCVSAESWLSCILLVFSEALVLAALSFRAAQFPVNQHLLILCSSQVQGSHHPYLSPQIRD
jgi:hypothetical protein